MTPEHFIPGKDASLEASIARLQGLLADRGFRLEERTWLNPVADCWSVHLCDADCPQLFTNGKGASQLAARASALGEFLERASCNHFWSHYHFGEAIGKANYAHMPQERWFPLGDDDRWPFDLLDAELQAFYNPDGSVPASALVEHNTGNAARGICALPHVRQHDGATVWFPVNLIGNLYVSNGLAAGNTADEARAQGLSEILERYVKFRVLREDLCLPEVPDEVIASYPQSAAGIAALRAAGFGIRVLDASLGGRFPVIVVTLLHPQDHGCYASFGAHPRFEVALERALTELLQGRALDALAGFPPPAFDADEVADPQNIEIHFVDSSGVISWRLLADAPDFDFVDWDFAGSTAEEFRHLCELIAANGHQVYIADFEHLGAYACRIIVPGMSEIYPVEDLEWENNSVANLLRPALSRLPELDADEAAELIELLDGLELADERPVAALIGLVPDPDSAWRTLRVGELRALLALASGDEDAAADGCAWVNQFGHLDAHRARVYRALEAVLRLRPQADYRRALIQLYGAETLAQAEALASGKQAFFGLAQLGPNYEGSAAHQKLLAAYRKVRGAHA
ncbi:30S ribosomal protein S12 methylthiotransferase accessory factor YcaO [Niveibacterium sp. 24ML]|uniref:30S ribosomal protein S12 methylthiotransferase accessory factor YcaO n=1 Tax=Niveibacterium sp. 24ML TaxID=2985512 RepID=UPI00227039DE|nr:30S ribosomal protein S12 methylthiotransferase accessory factor YcaO [Niveibacterium sp. 24ML]MCX9155005.1 30S ribosomal protein S12 methylthiotransferase accessory factor YcaO [Niveibacterium sp. 24ML]